MPAPDADAYIDGNLPRFLDDFAEIIGIPSISTDPEHEPDVRKAASYNFV